MTTPENIYDDIARDEAWLAAHLLDTETPDRELLTMRVAIELGEVWLERQIRDDMPADLVGRVKQCVAAELEERSPVQTPRLAPVGPRTFMARRAYVLASLAAALALAAGLWFVAQNMPGIGVTRDVAQNNPSPEFIPEYLDAWAASYEVDQFTADLTALQDDLIELEAAHYDGAMAALEWDDPVLDELQQQIELMLADARFDDG